MKKLQCLILAAGLCGIAGRPWAADTTNAAPERVPATHVFPALGGSFQPKVEVAWNRYYDSEGLYQILQRLHAAFPELTRLYSIGKSVDGRDLWCLELTAPSQGGSVRKPGMYIDGNIHGNEVQGGEAVAYTAWYLCHQYGRLEAVTELLQHAVLYLLPTVNPDGRDRWMHQPQNPNTSRSGSFPMDNDRDGRIDEDDFDDLDGDGSITMMRIRDPRGRWKPHPQFPELLMVEAAPDEQGEFTLLGSEGIDNDGDGRVNEDPVGGYDMNRNWAWDWQPNYIQYGAMDYPFQLPETRAIAEFIISHDNIAAAQSYHNFGGMILRGPGREGGQIRPSDDRLMQLIAQRGEKILPFYRSMVIWKDLYSVWGGELDWFYGARGIMGFTCEIFSSRSLDKGATPPSREDEAAFVRHVLLNDGATRWHPFNHPTYGPIEIGGMRQNWGRVMPSFLIEEECHRNMAFSLFHAAQLPRLAIAELRVQPVDGRVFKVDLTIENSRLIPTRVQQDVANRISPPDRITIEGANVKVLASGRVTDRFFKTVEPTKRRPERLEVDSVPGLGEVRVQFIIAGSGPFRVTVDSAKGGIVQREATLP